MKRHLTSEDIQRIQEEILKGKSKYQISKEMHIDRTTVYKYTKDLPNKYHREPYISRKPLELFKTTYWERICVYRGE